MPADTPTHLTDAQIREALSPFRVSLAEAQIKMIRDYLSLLLKWNRTVNLTAITDPLEVVARHFGESMYLSSLLPVENCRLADVGSGAGFPGLPLKILSPSMDLVLIDSNKRKCAFLMEVARVLGLSNVEILPDRFEAIRPASVQVNIITSRAVGEIPELLRWAKSAVAPHGHLALWLGSEDSTRIAKKLGWTWQPPVKLPESQRRFILIGRPIRL